MGKRRNNEIVAVPAEKKKTQLQAIQEKAALIATRDRLKTSNSIHRITNLSLAARTAEMYIEATPLAKTFVEAQIHALGSYFYSETVGGEY